MMFRVVAIAGLVVWSLGAAVAAELGTRVFVVEHGVYSEEVLRRIFAAFPARDNTLYFSAAYGLRPPVDRRVD